MLTAAKGNSLRFVLTAWKLNLAGAMEYRMSFFMTAGMMMLNNAVFLFFWAVYFKNFPVVKGWQLEDIMLLWAVGTGSFGICNMLFGNVLRIATIVANGELDLYLSQPKPVLLNVLVNRMSLSAIGDFLFGLILFGIFGDKSLKGIAIYTAALLLAGLLNLFFFTLTQSLAFYIGNAEGIGYQMFIGFITLSTYPSDIFKGLGKLPLFTVIPAGFIGYMPIGFMREPNWPFIWSVIGITAVFGLGAYTLFYRGLARYSSGNRMGIRS
jgi:ABC-2 type transport system permease protein